ncbi:MAG: DUF448 domain-containing protein [Sulfurovum sp.]|nr:MAG: DUF448 domain-containing protein [Sulfurovum sp.]
MKKNEPIRMCISCRTRKPQKSLIRLQHNNSTIVPFKGIGRSFYVCRECSLIEKKLRGLFKRFSLSNEAKEQLIQYLEGVR